MSSSDDDDCSSIASTALQDIALEIQDYMLDPNAKPWFPFDPHTKISSPALTTPPRQRPFIGPANTFACLVRENPDVFYPWVSILDPALVFALRVPMASRREFHGIWFRLGGYLIRSRKVRALLRLPKGRLKHYNATPACVDKVIKKGPLDIYDTWYSMSSEERQTVITFFNSLGVDWIDRHLP
jgi:hypothetical protein